jgi:hypothetical protein
MSLNSFTVKKFLLIAGLLIVMGQGLWQLPELQDYLFPLKNEELILQQLDKECRRMEVDLIAFNKRLDYLKWFQAHNGPDQKISADRLFAFPFSESIRTMAPRFFWNINIRLTQKIRLKVERKLRYIESLLKNSDYNSPVHSSHASPVIPAKPESVSRSTKEIQQFQAKCMQYNAKLVKLTKELAWLETNGYKN